MTTPTGGAARTPEIAAIDAEQRRIKRLIRSVGETDLERQIVDAGLGQPVREWRFHPPRRWRFDLAFVLEKLAIEVDGATWTDGRHNRGGGYEKDAEKMNQAALDGWVVLRFTTAMVKDGRALETVREALEALR